MEESVPDDLQPVIANDEYYAEQSPLSALDDHLIHQTPDPVRVMWTSDARAYEPREEGAPR